MKRKDYIDLKGKTVADLTKMISVKRTDAIKKKMQILGGKEKNLKVYRNLRADIAKILTLVREKEIVDELKVESDKQSLTSQNPGKQSLTSQNPGKQSLTSQSPGKQNLPSDGKSIVNKEEKVKKEEKK